MTDIVCVVADLARNPLYTAMQFAGALGGAPRVTVAGPSSGPLWPPMAQEAPRPRELPRPWPWTPAARRTLRELARGAHLLYAFKAMPGSLGLALGVGRGLDIPVALHLDDWDAGFFHDVSPLRRWGRGLRDLRNPSGDLYLRGMERWIPEVAFLTVSSRALQRRFGGTLVRQGVDVHRFDPALHPQDEARARLGLPPDVPVAVFAGTPRAHKGLEDLLGAMRRLRVPLQLLVAGVADDALAGALRAGGATVRGSYAFSQSGWVLGAADFAVIPQRDSPFARHQLPAKLLHAQALALPTLITDVGDAHELVGGSAPAGLVVPAGDPDALVEGLETLACDSGRRARMAVEARRRAVHEHGWPAMRDTLEALLLQEGFSVPRAERADS
ncbi:MAG: glycosyltransferase family 4 protein [Gemmatimonadota bacterium]